MLPPRDSLGTKAAALLCKAFYNIHRLHLPDIVKNDAKISDLISPGKHLPTTPGRPRLFPERDLDLSSLETQIALSCLVCLKLVICFDLFLVVANLKIGMNVKFMVSRLLSILSKS